MRKFLFDIDRQQHHFSLERLSLILLGAFIVFLILCTRLYYVTHHLDLSDKKDDRFVHKKKENFWREDILDTKHQPLALSHYCYDIGFNPKKLPSISVSEEKKILEVLKISQEQWAEFLKKERFSYVKKNSILTKEQLQFLKSISWVQLEKKIQRTYPLGPASAHLLGFISPKGVGLEGLEYVFDQSLKQNAFNETYWSSPKGQKKYLTSYDKAQGVPLVLSIDSRMQSLIYEACRKNVMKFPMESFSAVLMDIETFSLRALVTYPSYDPAHRPAYDSRYRMKALADTFEPGSVIKPVTMAFLLEKNPSIVNQSIETSPGYYSVDRELVQDIRNYGKLNLEGILIHSSNVGISKLVLNNFPGELLSFWKVFDLIQGSQVEFRPEGHGLLPNYIHPGSFSEATLSFGYGLKMNLVQLAQIYATMIGDGNFQAVTLLDRQVNREKISIFSQSTVEKMRELLKAPVEKGTAKRAFSEQVSIGGKTGTVRRLSDQGVYEKVYNSYFVGFFPADNPKYVLALYADNPQKQYYGGLVCAPVAQQVVPKIMNLP